MVQSSGKAVPSQLSSDILVRAKIMAKLTHCVLVTDDVKRLCDFYDEVLQMDVKGGDTYEEFHTDGGILAICNVDLSNRMAPDTFAIGSNRSHMVQFEVEDVDKEYARLDELGVDWVKPPTTQPWGSRSIWFRDPDGNVVDFFAWVEKKPE